MKPPFAYYGGKTTLAVQIAAALPPHLHYVEPFAGSLAVLLAKPRSRHETVNDLDGDLMTFWRVLRDHPEELTLAAALTPHSRAEHEASYEALPDADLERARRVWVRLAQGRSGTLRRTGWRFYRDPHGTSSSMPRYLAGYVERMPECAERIHGVSLECRPALDVIREYGVHRDSLLYVDPPYLGSTRAANYRHEMTSVEDHQDLLHALLNCKSAVVLSGYASWLYDAALSDWHRVELTAWTGNGIGVDETKVDGGRVEVLWSNRPLLNVTADLFSEVESA